MKKITLQELKYENEELLSRSQLKHISGGSSNPTGGGGGDDGLRPQWAECTDYPGRWTYSMPYPTKKECETDIATYCPNGGTCH